MGRQANRSKGAIAGEEFLGAQKLQLIAFARLLGRQAAREAFAERPDQSPEHGGEDA